MLLGTLGANLLGNLLTGRGATNKKGKGIIRADEGIVRAGYGRPSSSASHNCSLNSSKNNKANF